MSKKDDRYLEFPPWSEKQDKQPSPKTIASCMAHNGYKYHSVGMVERLLIADLDSHSLQQLTDMVDELKGVVGTFFDEVDLRVQLKRDTQK